MKKEEYKDKLSNVLIGTVEKAYNHEITKDDFTETIDDIIDLTLSKLQSDQEIKEKIISKRKSDDEHKQIVDKYLGSFFFNNYRKILDIEEIPPQMRFRFLYLCSYMNYENKLVNGKTCHQEYILENNLIDILKLSRADYFRTKKCFIENKLIYVNEDKTISINKKYCFKGKVAFKNKTILIEEYTRIFNEGIKEIYLSSIPKEHKKLGSLIKLLPYLNIQHNVLCCNPTEDNRTKIIPLNQKEISEILGMYETKNQTKLTKYLFSLRVAEQKVIGLFIDDDKRLYIVNPKVFYKGRRKEYDPNNSEILGLIGLFMTGNEYNKK